MFVNYEIIDSKICRLLDLNSESLGVTTLQLMENAGKTIADEVAARFKPSSKVVVFAGTGRNGGDGLVAARHLAGKEFNIKVVLVGAEDRIKDELTQTNYKAIKNMRFSVKLEETKDSTELEPDNADVIIDSLLGTGLKGALREPMATAIKVLNTSSGFKISVDVPSGIDSDSGETLGEAVRPDLTLTFHKMKTGLKRLSGHFGEIKVVDIGIPPEAEFIAGPGDLTLVIGNRKPESHKGDFGKLLVVGGSEIYSGAPALAALAALKVGVDLVYVAAPEETARTISSFSPDLITIKLKGKYLTKENIDRLTPFIKASSTIAIGSGLGDKKKTIHFAKNTIRLASDSDKPMVVDADAIVAFRDAKIKGLNQVVVTPHAGEFTKLTGISASKNLLKRINSVKETASDLESVILLKGNVDVVSDGSRVKLNYTGNPGMTVGGTGDVLTGIVASLLAQGFSAFESATAGAYLNGLAGDLACREKGYQITASDLIEKLPKIIMNPVAALECSNHLDIT